MKEKFINKNKATKSEKNIYQKNQNKLKTNKYLKGYTFSSID